MLVFSIVYNIGLFYCFNHHSLIWFLIVLMYVKELNTCSMILKYEI